MVTFHTASGKLKLPTFINNLFSSPLFFIMNKSRRNFIKSTAAGVFGFSVLPTFKEVNKIIGYDLPFNLPHASPESQGISSKAIRDFIKAANASGIDWHSFILVRHGNIIAEGSWKPFAAEYKHTLYSLSKSFTSTAIGMLVKDGKLKVDDQLISFFPDDLPAEVSDNMKKIKIRHVLTMNTGHGDDTMPKLRTSDKTWTKAYFEQPVPFEPGTHFLYNTGNTYMLGAIVYKVTGKTLEEFLAPCLFQPLDIKGYDWETSPQGLNTAGYGLRVKTEDIAKFGQLYLQKGKWNGKEILSEAWVNEATSYQTKSQEGNGDWSQGYGYQFWRCKPGFYRGDGAFGQFCIVMPEQDAVLAVTSESWDMQKSMTTMWENLLPAMQLSPLVENQTEWTSLKNDLQNLSLPVAKSYSSSSFSSEYNGTKFKFDNNDFGVTEMQFKFSKDDCKWIIKTTKRETTLKFGCEDWLLNKDSILYPFPVNGRIHVSSKIAGAAAWLDKNKLQLNAKFVEAIHGDKITCVFDDKKLSISFLNSVSENTKNNPENRKELSGMIG